MIYPIVAYGSPVLKKKAAEVSEDHEGLEQLIADMYETMYHANGVGIAAPQIGKSLRIFLVDTAQLTENEDGTESPIDEDQPTKQTFINAEILELGGVPYAYQEGCLSIPNIREDVIREETVKIRFQDADFNEFTEAFSGITARVILHEYDHIEGILFTDKIKPLRKTLLRKKLQKISKGIVNADYKMKFAKR